MRYISEHDGEYRLQAYLEHLEAIKDKLPEHARKFALADWHYEMQHRQCPHDAWVEFVEIKELASGTRREVRQVEIYAEFLGSYHDGIFSLSYKNVRAYSLQVPRIRRGLADVGHGDWLVDEMVIEADGMISHEVRFSDTDSRWLITCEDVVYRWRDVS